MRIFSYVVKDQKNETLKGRVEARNQKAAVDVLRSHGYVLIDLKEKTGKDDGGFLPNLFNKIKRDDIMAMTQQMSTMINAGLPLTDALEILRVQGKEELGRVISGILRDVQGGSSLADAFAKYPEQFTGVYIALVRAGEASGKLDEIMERLAETEERALEFRRKTKGALIYPVIVVIAMILVMMVMLIFVVPQLTAMYDDFGAELPLMTKILIGVSSFLRKMWWFGAILLVGGLAGFQSYRKTSQGRRKIDELKINLPIFGPINVQVMMAELARTLALLVSAGTSILEALDIVSKSVDNVVFQTALLMAARGVEKGNPLAAMLAKQQMFPPLMAQMISVGEETGELDQVLVKVSRYFEAEAEAKIKNLTTAIEPVIMIVLGIGVAFLVMSIVMPLYQLVNQF